VGRFNLADTVHVIKQVASALSATHAKGIVHRDLKPANVFLLDIEGEPDFVKVVDFGISKLKKASTKLTRPSVLMGTPSYMPPEQATGKADSADHRTDQWALGAVAWEMLSGQPPFVGKDVTTLLHAIANLEPPPLGARVSGLPPDVEAVLRRALAKRPGDRFPTVAAFARSLEAAATEPPAGAGDAGDRGGADASGAGGRAGHPGRTQTRDPRPSRRSAIATFFRSINPQALLAARAAAQERSRSRRRWLVTAAVAIPVVAVAAFFLFFHSGSQSLKGSLGELLGLDPPGASAADPASPSPKGRTRSAGAGDGEGSEGRASRTPRRPRAGSRADVETSPGHR
jgi:serine/threonine-protein kinase